MYLFKHTICFLLVYEHTWDDTFFWKSSLRQRTLFSQIWLYLIELWLFVSFNHIVTLQYVLYLKGHPGISLLLKSTFLFLSFFISLALHFLCGFWYLSGAFPQASVTALPNWHSCRRNATKLLPNTGRLYKIFAILCRNAQSKPVT